MTLYYVEIFWEGRWKTQGYGYKSEAFAVSVQREYEYHFGYVARVVQGEI